MKDVSIIIVNYNVKHFILQCLESIYKSKLDALTIEAIIVDNASIDGSVSAIKSKFPQCICIANHKNVGFGAANNQGIKVAQGKYILLLNPDTIIQENTITTCYDFMDINDRCGACGVKMVDGNGNYLPESKRSLPRPLGSLFKVLNFDKLFPNSQFFNQYYTSDLQGNSDEKVDVLCGAFMFCKSDLLKQLKGFDEKFFMYGEDIDLSKRILESGHFIQYISKTNIIHFKGESSKKASFNYLSNFYKAMWIYVDKHYGGPLGTLTKWLIKAAILIVGIARSIKSYAQYLFRPILDFVLLYVSLFYIKDVWSYFYFNDSDYYDDSKFLLNGGFYTSIFIGSLWFWGWYDSRRRLKSLLVGVVIGTITILSFYALFPISYRSSRVIILLGSLLSIVLPIITSIAHRLMKSSAQGSSDKVITLVVGYKENVSFIEDQLIDNEIVGVIFPESSDEFDPYYINSILFLDKVISTYKAEEVVFIHEDISTEEIIHHLTQPETKISYKIAGKSNNQIIGSDSAVNQGQIYDAFSKYNLTKAVYRRLKRTFDIILTTLCLLIFPFSFTNGRIRIVVQNCIDVFMGQSTLIGYNQKIESDHLPLIDKSIFQINQSSMPKGYIRYVDKDINEWYAEKYTPFIDLEILKNIMF